VGVSQAQVMYTDVNPDGDLSTPQGTYDIDFNNDAVIDVSFVYTKATGATGSISGQTYVATYDMQVVANTAGNNWIVPSSTSNNLPTALYAGQPIGTSGNFGGATNGPVGGHVDALIGGLIPYSLDVGNFRGAEGFLGVSFDIGGSTHYGWIRLETALDGTSTTIKDYAYDATAGTTILAGNTGSGSVDVAETLEDVTTIRNFDNKVVINFERQLTDANVTVTNLSGQQVANEKVTSQIQELDLNELSSGIYLVTIQSEMGALTKRVYVR